MNRQRKFDITNTVKTSKWMIGLVIMLCIGCNNNAKNKSTNLSRYLPIINELSNQGNWKEAIDIAKVSLQSTDQITDVDKANLYLLLGENYRFLEEYDKAEEHYKKVVNYSEFDKLSNCVGEAYYGLGDLNYLKWSYFKQEDALEVSKVYLDSAMIYAEKFQNLKLESKTLYRLGTILQIQGKKEESGKYFEKGLEISFSNLDTIGIIRNDIHKAAELEDAGILDSALFHYNRAYEYAKIINRNYAEAHSLCNLGLFYLDREDISMAKDYFNQAKFLSEELNHRIVLCRSYYGLSLVEDKLGNHEDAIKFAHNGLNLAREKGYKNYEQSFAKLIESL